METAVLLHVPEAEALVGAWRAEGDPAAARGVPAHVTLHYPFLPAERIDAGVLAELTWFFSHVDAFDVVFHAVREFARNGVVYLDPVGHELDELASSLARRWPEAPPYRGEVDRPHAHLTVVHTDDAELRARACRGVQPGLPITARAATAELWSCDGDGTWSVAEHFALGD